MPRRVEVKGTSRATAPVVTAYAIGEENKFVDGGSPLELDGVYHVRVDPDDPDLKVRGWLNDELDGAVAVTGDEGAGALLYSGEVFEFVPKAGHRRLSFSKHATAGTVPNPTDIACRVYVWRVDF